MSEASQFNIFNKIFVYCALIIFAPISSFFVSKYVLFEGLLGSDTLVTNVWSAVFAVIVLHLALGLFIYRAYNEAEKGKPEGKLD